MHSRQKGKQKLRCSPWDHDINQSAPPSSSPTAAGPERECTKAGISSGGRRVDSKSSGGQSLVVDIGTPTKSRSPFSDINGIIAHSQDTYNAGDRYVNPPVAGNKDLRALLRGINPGTDEFVDLWKRQHDEEERHQSTEVTDRHTLIPPIPSLYTGQTESTLEISTEGQVENFYGGEGHYSEPHIRSNVLQSDIWDVSSSFVQDFDGAYPTMEESFLFSIDPKLTQMSEDAPVTCVNTRSSVQNEIIGASEHRGTRSKNRLKRSACPPRTAAQKVDVHECNECDKRFDTSTKLKHHKRYHELPYACTHHGCTERRADKRDLSRHMQSHGSSPVRLYFCSINNCLFNTKGMSRLDNFRRHMKKKHGR